MISISEVPIKLRNIPTPPRQLFTQGSDVNELVSRPCVTVVGSRKVSAYGKTVTAELAGELARAGVVIISGLAFGVDSIAHKAALDAGGITLAVLPSPLDKIYPAAHEHLAKQILQQGGALVSEYAPGSPIHAGQFVERNRIASGLGDVLLVTEAAAKSGTLHTANFALDQGREVLAVPGNITSATSVGTNRLIQTGATIVTGVDDLLRALGIQPGTTGKATPTGSNPSEQVLIDLLVSGVIDGDKLLEQSKLDVRVFGQSLTMLELRGHIRALGGNRWGLQ